ncbi:MAG: tetratricopeptide repeat protein [Deltaproteobacteria bacterium]|nr:MAG: tetratricopeptide repeat protein [Deltaproteobacteria bacterium]
MSLRSRRCSGRWYKRGSDPRTWREGWESPGMETMTVSGRPGRALLCAAAVLFAACAGGKDSLDITKPVTGAEATNAERAYKRGINEKNDKNYIEATRYLEWVRSNFPYSQYSALAELALADMAFEREDFASAATAYQDFVKSHPSHPRADYASYRVGLAFYQDKPSDFWLLPPSYEKDQTPIRSANDALQRFVISYPKSEYVPRARDLINVCRERLAAHDRYVADFYWKRNAWKGAAGRFLSLADTYGDLEAGRLRGEALWRAGEAYRNLGDKGSEKKTLQRLVQEAPRNAEAKPPPRSDLPEPQSSTPPRPSPVPNEPQPTKPAGDAPR